LRQYDPYVVVRALLGLPSYHAINQRLFGDNLLHVTDEQAVTIFTRLLLEGLRVEAPPQHDAANIPTTEPEK
jgi:hypothetical protein